MSRCTATELMPTGVYRCVHETNDGHTEHYFNYYRAVTPEEKARLKSEIVNSYEDEDDG